MQNKIYKATRDNAFDKKRVIVFLVVTILFLSTAFGTAVVGGNTDLSGFFSILIIIFVSLGLFASILSQVNVWVEGNNLIVENKYKKEKRESVSLSGGLKLETEKKLRTNNKSNINLYKYLLHIKYNDGQEKKVTLTFTKKQDRTNLCNDIASNSDIDVSKLDLLEETQKIASISDIISIFKQSKSKTFGDVVGEKTSEPEVQKTDYKQQANTPVPKSGNTNFDMSGIIRGAFAVVVVGVVVYYYIMYIK